MFNKRVYYLTFLILTSLLMPGCKRVAYYSRCKSQRLILPEAPAGPTTIFVHGTLPPLLNLAIRAFDIPLGITPALVQGNRWVHGRIAYILNESACNQEFPLDSFYFFGWPGKLNFCGRKKAAEDLYEIVKTMPHPITIIGHSHGCNVSLNLAEVAKERGDRDFYIDRLVLLACPVQEPTEGYVSSPIFKRVISLYSTGDATQIMDPQGLYASVRKSCQGVPIFSQRTFEESSNLIQRRVLIDNRNMTHMEFIYKRFLSRLPSIIDILERSVAEGKINDNENEYILNLPRNKNCLPELLHRAIDNC